MNADGTETPATVNPVSQEESSTLTPSPQLDEPSVVEAKTSETTDSKIMPTETPVSDAVPLDSSDKQPKKSASTTTSDKPKTGSILQDSLPARQAKIMERLKSIRQNKEKILTVLRGLQENRKEGEELDKNLVAQMIESYDALRRQEDQYMALMQNIVMIRESAAEDVQHEVDESKKAATAEGATETNGDAKKGENNDTETVASKHEPTTDSIKDSNGSEQKSAVTEGGDNGDIKADENDAEKNADVWKEVEDQLQKLGSVTEEAVVASVKNEKLLATLQLHKEKREALKKLRLRHTEEQRGAAKDALEQVELTRLRGELLMF